MCWSSDRAQRPAAACAAERLEAAAAVAAAEADNEAERRRSRTSLSLPAALRLLSLPLPSSSRTTPSMCTGAQGLCAYPTQTRTEPSRAAGRPRSHLSSGADRRVSVKRPAILALARGARITLIKIVCMVKKASLRAAGVSDAAPNRILGGWGDAFKVGDGHAGCGRS